MSQNVELRSGKSFNIEEFLKELDLPGIEYLYYTESEGVTSYYFFFPGSSVTLFVIDVVLGGVSLSIDGLASWDDYKRFPYILDTLSIYMTGRHYVNEDQTAYKLFDEDWIAESMGEEIANLKAVLSITGKYYLSIPIEDGAYVSTALLEEHGVTLHSSTPRIHGYIHYLLENDTLPVDNILMSSFTDLSEREVDVPQHHSIGRVKSWMLDGSETWESYSQEDVDLLLRIGREYREGKRVPKGVVLNDIGTIYQMGIGVKADFEEAEYWFAEGYRKGDHWFSPTNLGDLYRKGLGDMHPDLSKAFFAYSLSDDPYAWFRIGQAWEEGWLDGKQDTEKAMYWYLKAREAGHHLAVRRLNELAESEHSESTSL